MSKDGERELIRIPQIVIERPEIQWRPTLLGLLLGALLGFVVSVVLKLAVAGESLSPALWLEPPFPYWQTWVLGGALLGFLVGLSRGEETKAELMIVEIEPSRPRLRFRPSNSRTLVRRAKGVDDTAATLPPRKS